ncbi:MAG: MASE1 domain-containing protein [Victivallales bacterium]
MPRAKPVSIIHEVTVGGKDENGMNPELAEGNSVMPPLSGAPTLFWREIPGLAFVAVTYWLAIRIGLLFAVQPEGISSIWPASGLALAILLIRPKRQRAKLLAVIFVTSAVSIWTGGYSLVSSLGFALVNMLEPALGALVLEYFCKSKITFERTAEIFVLLFVATVVSGVTSLMGATVSMIAFHGSFMNAWTIWWVSDGLGIILVTPVIVSWAAGKSSLSSVSLYKIAETALFVSIMTAFAWLLFGPFTVAEEPLLRNYMFFPLLIWLVFRFASTGVATMLLLFSVIAIWNTLNGHGIFSFAGQTRTEHLMSLQIFLTVVTCSGLIMSAVVIGRRRAEESLSLMAREWQRTFDSMNEAVWILDENNLVRRSNMAAGLYFHRHCSEMIGKHCWEIIHGTTQAVPGCPIMRARKSLHHESMELQAGAGWFDIAVDPILDEDGQFAGAVHVVTDITERKKAEAENARLEAQFRQSQKMEAIGQLAGGIAHDFNNQLMGIMGYAELLQTRLDDPSLRNDAENILRSARRASDLTRDLLAFSRKGRYLTVPVNVNKIIEEVISLLERSIDKRIEIKRILNANPVMISGDPSQIQNALLNLAINSKDALPNGGEIVFTTEKVGMEDVFSTAEERRNAVKGDYMKICVADDGMGINDEDMEHIFEPFFTTKQPGKGTGMGLASVYGTVKSHNGAIHVDSKLGEGTVFSLSFPLVGDTESADHETSLKHTIKKSRILLVDDEETVRTVVSKLLSSFGHEVVTCKDGLEAVELYRQAWKEIDLVMLDMMMPRMSGKNVFFEMQALNRDVKVLLISGFSIDGEAQSLLDAGMKGFLQKPFGKKILGETLEKVLS